jgi:hypothetical protein
VRLWPRRRRTWLLALAALAVVVRAALPAVVRHELVVRGSAAVNGRLEIGDVGHARHSGEVGL